MKKKTINALRKVCKLREIEVTQKIIDSISFAENAFADSGKAPLILDAYCGGAKSLWAQMRLLIDENVILLVEGRKEAIEIFNHITLLRANVGLALGWNGNECTNLMKHSAQAAGNKRKTLCRNCKSKHGCKYYRSERALKCSIIITTHANYVALLRKSPKWLARYTVIADEDISNFQNISFELKDLYQFGMFCKVNGYSLFKSAFPMLTLQAPNCCTFTASAKDTTVLSMSGLQSELKILQAQLYSGKLKIPSQANALSDTISKFIFFFKSSANATAAYAAMGDNEKLFLMRNNINLEQQPVKKFVVLNATARYSLNKFGNEASIYSCPELRQKHAKAKALLYIVISSQTKSNREYNLQQMQNLTLPAAAEHILIGQNKDGAKFTKTAMQLIKNRYPEADIVVMPRSAFYGSNDFFKSDLAVLLSTGLFNGIATAALKAALIRTTTITSSEIWDAEGRPIMHKGRFKCKELQDVFIKGAIADIYQGMFRTSLRAGKSAAIVVALPDVYWLKELSFLTDLTVCDVTGNAITKKHMLGFSKLLEMKHGQRIGKKDVAEVLGYAEYKNNKKKIWELLEGHFEKAETEFVRALPR